MSREPTYSVREGFSLVEVSAALGIVAVAMLSIVALLPHGLGTFREAMDTSVCAQIAQRVFSDMEQADFETLLQAGEAVSTDFVILPLRYFDDEGGTVEVASPSGGPTLQEAVQIRYTARIRAGRPGNGDTTLPAGFTSLPGTSRFAPRDSLFLTLQISGVPRGRYESVNADFLWAQTKSCRTYSTILARSGRRQ